MIRSLTGCRLTVTGKPSLSALRAAADRPGLGSATAYDHPAAGAPPAPARIRHRRTSRHGVLTLLRATTFRENPPGVFSRFVSVPLTLLGLLEPGPSHRYDLKSDHD